MRIQGVLTRPAVEKAIREFDRLGRERFLKKYDFGESRSYFLVERGRLYDSKAIIGAAYGYLPRARRALGPGDFSGCQATVKRWLESLEFIVRKRRGRGVAGGWPRGSGRLAGDHGDSRGDSERRAMREEEERAEESHVFDPKNNADARRRVRRSIVIRRGQPKFRRRLLKAYGGRCAITRCDCHEALEGAHIAGYKGDHTNHVTNGLLLRADVHTLFDLGWIAVDERTCRLLVHPSLMSTAYRALAGKRLLLPRRAGDRPNKEALGRHRQKSGLGRAG